MKTDDNFSSQYHNNMMNNSNTHGCDVTTWRIVAIVAGVGWLVTALLTCGILPILKESDPELQSDNNNLCLETPPVAVAYGVPTNIVPTSSTETCTILPDGTKRTEIITTNSDGSKTVTVTDERPLHP